MLPVINNNNIFTFLNTENPSIITNTEQITINESGRYNLYNTGSDIRLIYHEVETEKFTKECSSGTTILYTTNKQHFQSHMYFNLNITCSDLTKYKGTLTVIEEYDDQRNSYSFELENVLHISKQLNTPLKNFESAIYSIEVPEGFNVIIDGEIYTYTII